MQLSLRHVKAGTEDYEFVADLYDFSFPKEEQEKIENIMKVSETSLGEFSVVLDGDVRVGLLHLMMRKDLVYIYYLAIDPGMRKRGYGSAVLDLVRTIYPGHRFALNSEAPDDTAKNNEQRLERIEFYEKNGFVDSGTRTTWEGVTYALMTSGGNVRKHETWKLFRMAEKVAKKS